MRMLSGSCLCGDVRYEVADAFRYALNCHCSRCRRATGAAFKSFGGIDPALLRITAGAQQLHRYGDPGAHDVHCRQCGSLLYSLVNDGAMLHVTYGTLTESPTLSPTAHIFVGSKAAWFRICDQLPQHPELPV